MNYIKPHEEDWDQDFDRKVGERIRKARIKLNMSQEELASRINVSIQTIFNAETGKKTLLSLNLAKIAKVLDVSIDYLCFNQISDSDLQKQREKYSEITFDQYRFLMDMEDIYIKSITGVPYNS